MCEISTIGVLKHPRDLERCRTFQNTTPVAYYERAPHEGTSPSSNSCDLSQLIGASEQGGDREGDRSPPVRDFSKAEISKISLKSLTSCFQYRILIYTWLVAQGFAEVLLHEEFHVRTSRACSWAELKI